LKQFFDESKRSGHSKNSSVSYVDAKPSYMLQDEMLFDTAKRKEFERNKQKFDQKSGRNMSSSSRHRMHEFRVPSKSFESRTNDISLRHRSDDFGMRNILNINEPQQNYDCEASSSMAMMEKQENTANLAESFNLDGFKVSEDDDDDVSCR
jgi:hypothetical protein